ncbi:tail assembly chaperone [Cytobacillus sp. FSL R5-0569]|uniref:tail assembly chaperone n=1 Tax=unclassified Cytobacillus TaxID=2675268 RepID=UPI0030F635A2
MAVLTIGEREYEARTDFKFEKVANEKYNEEDSQGNKQGGLINIYSKLLEFDILFLSAFWDCALSHLKSEKPSLESIENAILKHIEENGDADQLFKDAFRKLDNSGFFKQKVKKYWKNLNLMSDFGETENEKKAILEMIEEAKENRKFLTEQTTKQS